MNYLLFGKIVQIYRLLDDANVSLINHLILLNYNKHCLLFNEYNYFVCIYADSKTIKRRVDDLFMNYCNEKL